MASSSTHPVKATNEPILPPVMTLQGHKPSRHDLQYGSSVTHHVSSISYFPDGQEMISGSWDKTARKWDLQVGKEIVRARGVCEGGVHAVEVSRDGRWVVTAGGNNDNLRQFGELRACEVETGIVKILEGHSRDITASTSPRTALCWRAGHMIPYGYGAWVLANSCLVHLHLKMEWALFDSRKTPRSWQSSQILGGALTFGMSIHRNWMPE